MKYTSNKGIYLLVDPHLAEQVLLEKLARALGPGVVALQLLDHFPLHQDPKPLILRICELAHEKGVPVLVNNHWRWLLTLPLDGVHFDVPPPYYSTIVQRVGRAFLRGITCNNDLAPLRWARDRGFDYVSFCSVFPSVTQNSCEPVRWETIRQAAAVCSMPIFLAGGMDLAAIDRLQGLPYRGIAVLSGIMKAEHPEVALQAYYDKLKTQPL